MFEAIERGEIKALWVMATNPAVSLPRAGAVRDALKRLELFVVSENVLSTDTVSGFTPRAASSRGLGREGRHSHQLRAAHLAPARLSAPPGRRPAGLVDRLRGRTASGPRRRVRLSQRGRMCSASTRRCRRSRTTAARVFDLSGLAAISDEDYDALEPMQWPVRQEPTDSTRLFADGHFSTPDRKARFIAPEPPALREATSAEYPLRLNTGRLRDQWHSMTRSGPEPQARRAQARAVPRNPSARRQAARTFEQQLRPGSARGTAPARSRS
jgi:assimilatory nitrate reductase catalytic subunit